MILQIINAPEGLEVQYSVYGDEGYSYPVKDRVMAFALMDDGSVLPLIMNGGRLKPVEDSDFDPSDLYHKEDREKQIEYNKEREEIELEIEKRVEFKLNGGRRI